MRKSAAIIGALDLLPHRQSPGEFKSAEAWATFLKDEVFSGLAHHQAFLIVQRLIENELESCRFTESTHRDVLKTTYFMGWLPESGDLFSSPSGMLVEAFVHTSGYITCDESDADKKRPLEVRRGQVTIRRSDTYRTKLTEPFQPPLGMLPLNLYHGGDVRAFEVAVGFEAMEALFKLESQRSQKFAGWYVRSAIELNMELKSEETKSALTEAKTHALYQLLEFIHSAQIAEGKLLYEKQHAQMRELVLHARSLRLELDHEPIKLGNIRYTPVQLLHDAEALL